MKRPYVEAQLNYYGYEVRQINNKSGYTDRKRPVYGVYCRRSGSLMCAYTNFNQIYKWLSKSLLKPGSK